MGTPNDQTETVRAVVLLALLAVFVVGIDPLMFWLATLALGITEPLWGVYAVWMALISFAVTIAVLIYLTEDHDKTPPTTIRRIGGRIT